MAWLFELLTDPLRRKQLALGYALLVLLTLAAVAPGIYDAVSSYRLQADRADTNRAELKALKATLAAPVSFDQLTPQAHSEAEMEYYRKQLLALSKLEKIDVQVVSRAHSPYIDASKLTLKVIAPPAKTPRVLDFLQLGGYLESYENGTAVLHLKKFPHPAPDPA